MIFRKPEAPRPDMIGIGPDLHVCRLGLGTLRLTGWGAWGRPKDLAQAREVLRQAVARGVDFIDTADSYGPGAAESLIAETLRPYRSRLLVATKGGYIRTGPWRWVPNGRPDHLRQACEGSLRRLRLEAIDLYQLHWVDPDVPIEESAGALFDLRRQGRVRHVGLCNVSIEELERVRPLGPVVSVQNRFNIATRRWKDMVVHCREQGIVFIPYAPLASGKRRALVEAIARKHGATARQVALAWLLDCSPNTLPIPSATQPEHLVENLGAPSVELDDDDRRSLTPRGWMSPRAPGER